MATAFTLGNGLRVLVHEDHRAPLVAVHVAYRVGAADEHEGRHGLAHLFEHLMYGGSHNLPGSYLKQLLQAGAHDLNGRTGLDSTHYFETVHRQALEFALFAESDRMGHLALGEDTLERQRKVVLGELRQHRERSDGSAQELLAQMSYPQGHPYRHGIIGSEDDLQGITIDDAREFAARFYHPGNALLALAGDIAPAQALRLCARYFGGIPVAASLRPRPTDEMAAAVASRRVEASVLPVAQLYRVWKLPAATSLADEHRHAILAALVHTRLRASTGAGAAARPEFCYRPGRLGARMELRLACDGDAAATLAGLDREWRRLLDEGFDAGEVERAHRLESQRLARRLDSRQGIADRMIEVELLVEPTDSLMVNGESRGAFPWHDSHEPLATPCEALNVAISTWLSPAPFELDLRPQSTMPAREPRPASRKPPVRKPGSAIGAPARAPAASRIPPAVCRPVHDPAPSPPECRELEGGPRLMLANQQGSTLLAVRLLFPGGGAFETFPAAGLAQLSADLLQSRDHDGAARPLRELSAAIGVELTAQARADCIRLAWTASRSEALQVLRLAMQAVAMPCSDDALFERVRRRQLSAIRQELASAEAATQRVLPGLLFGEAAAWTASGSLSGAGGLSIEDLVGFHQRQYRLQEAICLLVGDVDVRSVASELGTACRSAFRPTLRTKRVGLKADLHESTPHVPGGVHRLDIAGAAQALVTVAWSLPAPQDPKDEAALQAVDGLLARRFSSILNLRLREELGWTYGVRSRLSDEPDTRRYEIQVWVAPERATDTRFEILRAVGSLIRDGVGAEALEDLQRSEALRAAGSFERVDGMAKRLEVSLRLGLPIGRLKSPCGADLQRIASLHLAIERAVTVIAGHATS